MIARLASTFKDIIHLKLDPIKFARSKGVTVGKNCRFINIKREAFGSEPYLISIGDHVTITNGVQFITHDGGVWVFREKHPDIDLIGPIKIGNNVFVGLNTIIMPGVEIGDNCVIGAGSVVTKSIPSNVVAVGAPAKPIKTIDEYWDSIQDRVLYSRSLSISEKKELFQHRFIQNEPEPASIGN